MTNPDDTLFLRQLDWYNPDTAPNPPISLVGLGGIGSVTGEGLVRLGIKQLFVFDPDIVELHNVANQMFTSADIGSSKIDAFLSRVKSISPGSEVNGHKGLWQDFKDFGFPGIGICISAVDNMWSRKELFEYLRSDTMVSIFIDVRLAGQVIDIFTVRMQDLYAVKAYEKSLYSDDEATPLTCTAAGIADIMFMIGGLVVQTVRNILVERVPVELFRITYDHFNHQFYHFDLFGDKVELNPTEDVDEISA